MSALGKCDGKNGSGNLIPDNRIRNCPSFELIHYGVETEAATVLMYQSAEGET
jgi:hypothetical protein